LREMAASPDSRQRAASPSLLERLDSLMSRGRAATSVSQERRGASSPTTSLAQRREVSRTPIQANQRPPPAESDSCQATRRPVSPIASWLKQTPASSSTLEGFEQSASPAPSQANQRSVSPTMLHARQPGSMEMPTPPMANQRSSSPLQGVGTARVIKPTHGTQVMQQPQFPQPPPLPQLPSGAPGSRSVGVPGRSSTGLGEGVAAATALQPPGRPMLRSVSAKVFESRSTDCSEQHHPAQREAYQQISAPPRSSEFMSRMTNGTLPVNHQAAQLLGDPARSMTPTPRTVNSVPSPRFTPRHATPGPMAPGSVLAPPSMTPQNRPRHLPQY